MEHWKRTIERANRCFMQGELVDAREAYLQALALAQVLFERWANADEAVAACVISHHNLADLHLRLNQPEESAEYLCAIHQRLLQAMQDAAPEPAAARGGAAPEQQDLRRTVEFHQRSRRVPAYPSLAGRYCGATDPRPQYGAH